MTAGVFPDILPWGSIAPDLSQLTLVTESGDRIPGLDMIQKHTLATFVLVEGRPGFPAIRIKGAAFEFDRPSGRRWLDLTEL
eukprot:5953764-Pyramimonas_sp.AAC.1